MPAHPYIENHLRSFIRVIGLLLLGSLTCSAQDQEITNRTTVRIEGLTGLTEKEVLTRLGGRLDFITSRPPSRSRADDADFLVSSILEKEGYSDVNISWKIPADRRSIILRVKSGLRLTLDDIRIEGVAEEEGKVMRQFFTGKSLLGGKAKVPYLADKTNTAAENAIVYLKAQGYWNAKGELQPPVIQEENQKVNLTLKVQPGSVHTISSLKVKGSIPEDLATLPERLQQYLGEKSTATVLRDIREGAAAELRNLGYQFSNTFLEAKHKDSLTELTLTLVPGERYRFRELTIIGEEGTDITRVQKFFNRFSGDPFEEKTVTKLRNGLLSTGAFDSIDREQNIDSGDRAIDVTLHLKEGKPKGVSYYAGVGSTEGLIIGASYYNRNFLNKLYNLNIAAEYSLIGVLGEISVTDPYLLGYDLRATPRAFALTRTFDEYFKFETGFGLTISRKIGSRQTLQFDSQLSFATVSGEDLPTSELGATDYLLTTAGISWLYDGRDSKTSPADGFFSRISAEVGAVAAQEPNAFLRFEAQASYHHTLDEKNRLSFNLRTGVLAPTNEEDLPVDLRFFIGGADSVRSFPFRELGPNVDGVSRGGQSFWYANIEYIRKLAGPLSGVIFLDAGSLDEEATSFPSFDPRVALGVGLRLDLPIGPVRFEYGQALNPASEDPSGAFHFSIGASF